MIFYLKIEYTRLAPFSDLDICASSTPTGTSAAGVRQAREQIVHLGLDASLAFSSSACWSFRPATSPFFASASSRFPACIRPPISLLAALRSWLILSASLIAQRRSVSSSTKRSSGSAGKFRFANACTRSRLSLTKLRSSILSYSSRPAFQWPFRSFSLAFRTLWLPQHGHVLCDAISVSPMRPRRRLFNGRGKVLWHLDGSRCDIGLDRNFYLVASRNSGFLAKCFRDAQHIFTAHSDDGTRVNGSVHRGLDRHAFRPKTFRGS